MSISYKDFLAIVSGKVPEMITQEVLLLAVAMNNTAVVEDLIAKGYQKNIGIDLEQCLFVAVKKRYLSIVKLLVKAGVNVNFPAGAVLLEAIIRNSLPIVKFLVHSGAYIDIHSYEPLKLAIMHQRMSIIKFLVEKGANIDYSDALIYAIHSQNISIVEYFISKGAVINDLCFSVAASNEYYDILQFLFKKIKGKISINLVDALNRAIEHNHTKIAELLIVTHKTPVDRNMLYTAIENNNIDIVRFIIQQNVKVDDQLLSMAVAQDNAPILILLLQNKKDAELGPLFRKAVSLNRPHVIKLIVALSIEKSENVKDCVYKFIDLSVSS